MDAASAAPSCVDAVTGLPWDNRVCADAVGENTHAAKGTNNAPSRTNCRFNMVDTPELFLFNGTV
jgi:hypothetical protein